MEHLYAPWRSPYSEKVDKNQMSDGCVFCDHWKKSTDEDNFVLCRLSSSYIMLNLYPYNAGHLLVVPEHHHATLDAFNESTRAELIESSSAAAVILKEQLGAQGINLGINMGKFAGAGIPDHLHIHVLPRFAGDTNYMPLLAGTKHVSFDLKKIFEQLRPHFLAYATEVVSLK